MRDYITVHGTIKRSARLERAVAEVIKEVRRHEKEVQNQKILPAMVD